MTELCDFIIPIIAKVWESLQRGGWTPTAKLCREFEYDEWFQGSYDGTTVAMPVHRGCVCVTVRSDPRMGMKSTLRRRCRFIEYRTYRSHRTGVCSKGQRRNGFGKTTARGGVGGQGPRPCGSLL